jgi:hypothetical protein
MRVDPVVTLTIGFAEPGPTTIEPSDCFKWLARTVENDVIPRLRSYL